MKRILTKDDLTGTTTFFHKDAVTGHIGIQTVQDIEPVLERNKALQNEQFNKKSEMWPVGTVPMVILYQWALEAGVKFGSKEHGEVIKRKLNDPDNRGFRTGVFKY